MADKTWFRSTSQQSMWAFVAFTVVQIVTFVYAPQIYDGTAPGLDMGPAFPFMRLIGIKEIGLMAMYASFTALNDRSLIFATVVGRSTVLPYSLYIVFGLGASASFLAATIQDFTFCWWTLYGLRKEWARDDSYERPLCGKQASFGENLCRAGLLFAGLTEMANGAHMFLDPEGYTAHPIVALDISIAPLHIGFRGLSFMSFLVGCYEAYFALIRAPWITYACAGFHHFVFFALGSRIAQISGVRELDGKIDIPQFHAFFAVVILMAAGNFGSTLLTEKLDPRQETGKGRSKSKTS